MGWIPLAQPFPDAAIRKNTPWLNLRPRALPATTCPGVRTGRPAAPMKVVTARHMIPMYSMAKVDELVALCGRLKTSLTTADDTRCRLLGTLLIESLEPSEGHASDQAERTAVHG